MKNLFKLLIINVLIVILPLVLEAKPPDLTPHTTRKKTEEIFKAHVSHKDWTSEIMRRTIENFLQEIDPIKSYLTENQIIKWKEPTPQLLDEAIKEIKKEKFTLFEEIYKKAIEAIERRNQLEEKLTSIPLPQNVQPSEFKELTWSKTEEELANRLLRIRALQLTTAEKIDFETKEQFSKRLIKRRLGREQELLQHNASDQTKQLLALFLKAFTAALDNHTVYFTPHEAKQFMIQVQQRLFGIGAQLRDDLSGFTLVRLLEGGPALRSGKLKEGDKIIAVNKEPVVGMEISDAVELIRGPEGSSVTLTILRESSEEKEKKIEPFDVDIVRDEIVLKEARFESEALPYGDGVIAHIRLHSFYQDPKASSASDLKEAINHFKQKEKLLGVILDMRNNSGGLLPQAVAVTGLFIKKGVVVSIKDSSGTIQHLRNLENELTWDGPLLVLTNKGSASAAEIVAQTLQDYGRAILIGDPHTWGKGSYQTFTLESSKFSKINPQGEYKVTRGLYYTVSGKSPQLHGTPVDVEVPGGLIEAKVGESFAKFPLENDQIPPNFTDTLSDVHPIHRGKMMAHYKKDKQEKLDLYGSYITTLKKNSEKRISTNKNYQNFLKEVKKEELDLETVEKYGQNDLQLEETSNIMKDLILLLSPKTPAAAAVALN
ncbi:MAG: PDZ domain-containing protein [Simkania negevensis]|nr:PDZ domain-containing protein [Simkania negevensis]